MAQRASPRFPVTSFAHVNACAGRSEDLEPSSKELDLSTNAVGVEDDEEITGDESALQETAQ
eukprot:3013905-Amphidinium_carterae.1